MCERQGGGTAMAKGILKFIRINMFDFKDPNLAITVSMKRHPKALFL